MTPTRKIIALVDGLACSASVCDHATWIAQRSGAPVDLIHVLGRRGSADTQDHSRAIRLGARTAPLTELAEWDAQRAELMSRRGRAILEDARAIPETEGVTDIAARLRLGDVVEAVTDVEGEARVIVIGMRGEDAGLAGEHPGPNLERIVRASHRPVLVASRAFRPIAKVLVARDGGEGGGIMSPAARCFRACRFTW